MPLACWFVEKEQAKILHMISAEHYSFLYKPKGQTKTVNSHSKPFA